MLHGDHLFCGATSSEIASLSGIHTNIQHQLDNITAISDTAFKVVDGLIELTEDITLEGYDVHGNAYTFAGATPAEITALNGVTSPVQTQLDAIINDIDTVNSVLETCIKHGENTPTSDIALHYRYTPVLRSDTNRDRNTHRCNRERARSIAFTYNRHRNSQQRCSDNRFYSRDVSEVR